MQPTAIRLEDYDKSKLRLPFESPYFPAYFRLLKWKFLDVCVESTRNNDIGYFKLFESLFPPGKLEEIARMIIDEPTPVSHDPDMIKIRNADLDVKIRKQAETYVTLRHAHQQKVQRRRFSECFLNTVLFDEKGLRIADEVMFNYDKELYGYSHWEDLPDGWLTAETFKNKFYDEEEVTNNPFGYQKLDRVAGAARGMIIMKHLKSNPRCVSETTILAFEVFNKGNHQLSTDLVEDLLTEGPAFELKIENGEEKKYAVKKWSLHKTLTMFLAIIGFKSNDKKEKNEHEEWYYGFIDAMKNDPANRAALYFLDKNWPEELEEREKERDRIRLTLLKSQRTNEEAVGEDVCTTIRPQPKDSGYNPDAVVTELVLRTYQEELVQPALEGKNCVIVAPTGSGKTEVAIYAALKHIEERTSQGKPSRVVLLVPKIPLVGQQKDRFLKYCNGMYEVNGFHGSESSVSGTGRRDEVIATHVSVMTPQILINMLQSVRQNERLYVSDFSMMIFDEVHKAAKNHPYVLINQMVQEWKYEKPQIIGLTASLSVKVDGQKDENQMLNDIYNMLALINAPHLSTITRQSSIDELNEHVGKPDDSVELCLPAKENILRDYIERYLNHAHGKFLEELASMSKSTGRNNTIPPNMINTFKKNQPKNYEYYDSLLQGIIQELNKLNVPEKWNSQTWAKYMKVYLEARGIVDLMPAMVAFKYMEKAIGKLNESHSETVEYSTFIKDHDTLKQTIQSVEPEIVLRLKNTLTNQFHVAPESRVIIFVTQRSTAQRVSDFLNESKVLDQFGNYGEQMVGYVLGTNKQGAVQQTSQEQQLTLDKFNNGRLKVIVATSVVEEGLDVTACNLIIKYNCSSGSAIQLVQQRGRARAKNSRSVLLSVKSSINETETNALISEKYMRLCVKKITENGEKQLAAEVKRVAELNAAERKRNLEEQLNLRLRHENKIYKLMCSNCSKEFCKSIYIKKVFSNYMVFDPSVWRFLHVESKRKVSKYLSEDNQPLSDIKCFHCKLDVGRAYKIRGTYLPQLSVKALTFVQESDYSSMTKAKWSDVEQDLFYISEAIEDDFRIMLNALSDTEENIEKKIVLDLDSRQHNKQLEMKRFHIQQEPPTKGVAPEAQ